MKARDRKDFEGYLKQCTDNQVFGVYEKEKLANRKDYLELAISELKNRSLIPNDW